MSKPQLIQELENKALTTYVDEQDSILSNKINALSSKSFKFEGNLPDNTNLKSLNVNYPSASFVLNPSFTYTNCPNLNGQWAILEIDQKSMLIKMLNKPLIYYCSNSTNETLEWNQLATATDTDKKMDKLILMPNNSDLNQDLSMGNYQFFNASANFPSGYVGGNNDFILQIVSSGVNNYLWQTQTLTDIRSGKQFRRTKLAGTYGVWQEITTTESQTLKAPNARGSSTTPSDYINSFKVVGLKTGAECGLDGKESLVHVFGINAWADTTAGVVEFLVGGTGKVYKRYRKSATEWYAPIELSTTEKTDVALNTGWSIVDACGSTYVVNGNTLTYSTIIRGDGTNIYPVKLLPPKNVNGVAKWYGGSAISSNNLGKYCVVQPDGWLCFQAGYETNVPYSINISYPI